MTMMKRHDVNHQWAHSGLIEAGPIVFVGYCVGNPKDDIQGQIEGAFNHLEERLRHIGLDLSSVVQMDCLFSSIWDIPRMEEVIKRRFKGKYPVRKSMQTEFAHEVKGEKILFQVDAIAYRANL